MALYFLNEAPPDRSTLPVHGIEHLEGAPDAFRLMEFGLLDLNFLASFPHRHSFYSILLIQQGQGRHCVDFHNYDITAPCLFFLSPGQVHYWKLTRAPKGRIISFKPDFIAEQSRADNILYELDCFHGILASPLLPLSPDQDQSLTQLLELMQYEYRNQDSSREPNLRSCLAILLNWVKRWFETSSHQAAPENAPLIRRFMGLVSQNFQTERAVSHYAKTLGLSSGHLNELVKQATGRSPGRIIREQVFLEAKRLLAHTELSIAEVGYKLLFEDPAYFSRFFRRQAGTSPGEFRKQALEKYQQS